MSQLEDIISVKLSIHMVFMDIEDAPKKKLSHSGVRERNSQDFIKQAQSKKTFHLVAIKTIIIKFK
jgi:hypothetical protein